MPKGASFRPDLEAELFAEANAYRRSQGKPPLKPSDLFLIPARAHAADMMVGNFVGHRASTGQEFDGRMRAFVGDVTRFPTLGENAARDTQKTPADKAKATSLFRQWVNSPPHRRALVSLDYIFVSTGVVQRGNNIYAVQIFFGTPREKGLFQ
ncbi:MAG: CAP domain-containing protein [Rhizobiales bacterium]|nr:CAP domain-containing protein [Hyphomicrobiales bacterium]